MIKERGQYIQFAYMKSPFFSSRTKSPFTCSTKFVALLPFKVKVERELSQMSPH